MLIFIIGYMGAGKTTLGRKIADRLQYRFLDLDEMLEISTGYPIAVFFEKFGEQAFRQKEKEVLHNHLADKDTVLATGGGTPCYEDNMEMMNRAGVTVFVDAGHETIMKRLSGKFHIRPLLSHIPEDSLPSFIAGHMASRRVFYEQAKLMIKPEEPDIITLINRIISLPQSFSGQIPDH